MGLFSDAGEWSEPEETYTASEVKMNPGGQLKVRHKSSKVRSNQKTPITCDLCEFSCFSVQAMKKHKIEHSETMQTCKLCGKYFENFKGLKTHLARVHKNSGFPISEDPYLENKSQDSNLLQDSIISDVEEELQQGVSLKEETVIPVVAGNLPSMISHVGEELLSTDGEYMDESKPVQEDIKKDKNKKSKKTPKSTKLKNNEYDSLNPMTLISNEKGVNSTQTYLPISSDNYNPSKASRVCVPPSHEEEAVSLLYPQCLQTASCHCTQCLPCLAPCCHNPAVRSGQCCREDNLGSCLQPFSAQCCAPCCYPSVVIHPKFKVTGNQLELRETLTLIRPLDNLEDLEEAEDILAETVPEEDGAGDSIFAQDSDDDENLLFESVAEFLLEMEDCCEEETEVSRRTYQNPSALPPGCRVTHHYIKGRLHQGYMAPGGAVFQSLSGLLSYYHRQVGQHHTDIYSDTILEHPTVGSFLLTHREFDIDSSSEDSDVLDNLKDDQGMSREQQLITNKERSLVMASGFQQNYYENELRKAQHLDFAESKEMKKEFVTAKKSEVSEFKPLTPVLNTKVVKKSTSPNTSKKRLREQSKEEKTNISESLLQNTVKASITVQPPNVKKAKASGSEHLMEKTLKQGTKSGLTSHTAANTGAVVSPIYSKIPMSIGDNKPVVEPSPVHKKDLYMSSSSLTKKQAMISKSHKPENNPKLTAKAVKRQVDRTLQSATSMDSPRMRSNRVEASLSARHSSTFLERTSSALLRVKGRNTQVRRKLAPMGPMKYLMSQEISKHVYIHDVVQGERLVPEGPGSKAETYWAIRSRTRDSAILRTQGRGREAGSKIPATPMKPMGRLRQRKEEHVEMMVDCGDKPETQGDLYWVLSEK